MTVLKKKTENEANWVASASRENPEKSTELPVDPPAQQQPEAGPELSWLQESTELPVDPPAQPQAKPELSWLKEIGWYNRARDIAANRTGQGHRIAPMHPRAALAAEGRGLVRPSPLAPKTPPQLQNAQQPKQIGSFALFGIGAMTTLIAIICFIAAYDISSGGGFRKVMSSVWQDDAIQTAQSKAETLAEANTPSAAPQQKPIPETVILLEEKSEAVAKPVQPATAPVKPATAETPPAIKPVPVKPAAAIAASEPAPAQVKPKPVPAAIEPPPAARPAIVAAAAPVPQAPAVAAPQPQTEIALAAPQALQKTALAERDVFKDCDGCPEMVVVQAGSFRMGSAADDVAAQPNEQPAHDVTISKPFAIGRFEITAGDWARCVAAKACEALTLQQPWNAPQRPAVKVSWDGIQKQYLPWLSKVTGKTYRLPTEAEWEYAAKGGSAAGSAAVQEYRSLAATVAVGSGKPNSLGVYDMQGNAWEWVEDCMNTNYSKTPVDGSAAAFGDCTLRVARGGSWSSSSANQRITKRGWNKPTTRNNSLGFRVVRSL